MPVYTKLNTLKNKIDYKKIERINKIGVCLRNDKEKFLQGDLKKELVNYYSKQKLKIFDTLIDEEEFIYEDRYNILLKLLNEISQLDIVITDRLHGMIFCYITGTPCIAFDNDNHKISETYKKWLEETCNYIILLEDNSIDILIDSISKLKQTKKEEFISLSEKFKIIDQILLEE